MTDQQHPVTPSPELVQQLIGQAFGSLDQSDFADPLKLSAGLTVFATRSAQWGADQELEACCKWLDSEGHLPLAIPSLRAARRPRRPPLPSLAEEALKRAAMLEELARSCGHDSVDTIRRALERLQELEGGDG